MHTILLEFQLFYDFIYKLCLLFSYELFLLIKI